jgi:low temperature requirement protein LtrA
VTTSPTAEPDQGNRANVGWFELFYDLVVVAAVTLCNDAFLQDPSTETAKAAALGIVALSWVWFLTTLFNNLFPGQDLVRRLLMLMQMAAIITAALAIDQASGINGHAAILAYAVALAAVVALIVSDRFVHPARHPGRMHGTSLGPLALAIALCVAGGFAERLAAIWFLTAALVVSIVPILTWQYRYWRGQSMLRLDHLRERLGLFVLIILGEGFAQLVAALHTQGGIPRGGFFALMFLVSFALWWIYFDGTFSEDLDLPHVRWRLSLLGHLTLVFGIAGTLDILVLLTAQLEDDIGPLVIEYFAVSIGVVLLSFALLRYAAKGRIGGPGVLHIISGLLVIAIGLLLGEGGMDALYFVIVGSAVLVGVNGLVAAVMQRGRPTLRPSA